MSSSVDLACETFVHDINVLYADVDDIQRRLGIHH